MKSNKKHVKPLTAEQQKLVEENMKFAQNLALHYVGLGQNKGIPAEDLQQEACYGMCVAAQKYNKDKGVEFTAYAYTWCLGYIMNAIKGEHDTTDDDVELLEDEHSDEDDTADDEMKWRVRRLMHVLTVTECDVICHIYGFYGEPLGFRETAREMGISVARVRQIYNKALNKMEVLG